MDFFLLISSFPWALPGNALPERLPPRHPRQSLDPAFDFRLCVLELGWHRHCTRDKNNTLLVPMGSALFILHIL